MSGRSAEGGGVHLAAIDVAILARLGVRAQRRLVTTSGVWSTSRSSPEDVAAPWYVGLGLLLLVIFGFDVVAGEASLPWDLGGTSLATIIGVALLVIAGLLAPMVYFGSRIEDRTRSGDGAAATDTSPHGGGSQQ